MPLFFENADEFLTDDLALLFGVGNTLELVEEAVFRVHCDEVHAELILEHLLHLLEFALAEQPVIDENAYEVVAYRFVDERGAHRAVHAAGKPEQHLFVTDLRADGGNLFFDEILVHLSSCDEAQDAPTPNLAIADIIQYFFCQHKRAKGLWNKILIPVPNTLRKGRDGLRFPPPW